MLEGSLGFNGGSSGWNSVEISVEFPNEHWYSSSHDITNEDVRIFILGFLVPTSVKGYITSHVLL